MSVNVFSWQDRNNRRRKRNDLLGKGACERLLPLLPRVNLGCGAILKKPFSRAG